MRKIYQLVSRTIRFNSSYATNAVKARIVSRSALRDYVVDWESETAYRAVDPVNVLEPGDVLLAYRQPLDKDIATVGIYHPGGLCLEPLTVSSQMVALRPHSYEEGLLLLMHLLPFANHRRHWLSEQGHWSSVKELEVKEIPSTKIKGFCGVLWKVHKLQETHRQVGKLLDKLVPAVAYDLGKEAQKG